MARESNHRARVKANNLAVRIQRGRTKALRKAERAAGPRRRWFGRDDG